MFAKFSPLIIAKDYLLKGDRLYSNRDFESAMSHYRVSLYFNTSAKAHYKMAVVYKDQDKFIEAIGECSAALNIDPENGGILNFMGDCFYGLGLTENAMEIFSEASLCSNNENRSYSYFMMGKLLRESGKWWMALSNYNKALELEPGLADAKKEVDELGFVLN